MNHQTCPDCLRYRARIHQLARDLDKLSQEVGLIRHREEWNQKYATDALKRVYGDKYKYGNSYMDRMVIGTGIRTLLDIGIGMKTDRYYYGSGQTTYKKIRYWFINTFVIKPLKWLVGIPNG